MANLSIPPNVCGLIVLLLACLPIYVWSDGPLKLSTCSKLNDKGKQELFLCPDPSSDDYSKGYCCGLTNHHYCCTQEEYEGFSQGLGIVIIIVLVVVAIIIFAVCLLICCCCCSCCYLAQRRQQHRTVVM